MSRFLARAGVRTGVRAGPPEVVQEALADLKILYILYDILYVDAKVLSGERTSLLLPIFIIQMKMEVLRLL